MAELQALMVGAVLPLSLMFISLLCFSLRDFSRTILEEVCESNGDSQRFVRILKSYEHVLVLSEIALLTLVISTCVVIARSTLIEMFSIPEILLSVDGALWVIRIFGAFLLATTMLIVVPWLTARVRGEQFLFRVWPVLELLNRSCDPLWKLLARMDRTVHRLAGLPDPGSSADDDARTEELRGMIEESRLAGLLARGASHMIHRVIDLQEDDAATIMTPRNDVVTIMEDTTLRDAIAFVVNEGYSRVPVIEESIDEVTGILYSRDLLAEVVQRPGELDTRTVRSIARDVVYVPETQGIEALLEGMLQQKVHMAVVVDEYSGVSGIVTLEDILEEIVGEIADEYDEEEQPMLVLMEDGTVSLDARYHIDNLNRALDLELPEDDDYDTLAGFMMVQTGRIPSVGESINWKGITLTVLDASDWQLKRIRLIREQSC
ncbi:MAG: HlyC/CorC family transporter [Planctomycetaceae bacterium]|nr:HlyC/CorC family transporter [Planctomycetaceae bacterium]